MTELLSSQIEALKLKRISTSDISDLLWNLGYQLDVPGSIISPIADIYVVGPVTTMQYLPQRHNPQNSQNKLNHKVGYKEAKPGDVLVMIGDQTGTFSVLGGNAAKLAKEAGIIACLVDGAIRDTKEIHEIEFPVWTRAKTPKTGRFTLELSQVNCPVNFCGIQVLPGDIAVADTDGICFIPREALKEIVQKLY